jgi:hypothetical protein
MRFTLREGFLLFVAAFIGRRKSSWRGALGSEQPGDVIEQRSGHNGPTVCGGRQPEGARAYRVIAARLDEAKVRRLERQFGGVDLGAVHGVEAMIPRRFLANAE